MIAVPDTPRIGLIEGDGIGRDISPVGVGVLDAAVERVYRGSRKIAWLRLAAGEQCFAQCGTALPGETIEAIRECRVAIKGPLTTPLDGRYRSANHDLRERLELYVNCRPVRYMQGLPSPLRNPDGIDLVVLREATEDVLGGPNWAPGTPAVRAIRPVLAQLGADIREQSALGLKVVSEFGTKRMMRRAIRWGMDAKRSSITLAHFADALQGTEGAFRQWAREVVDEFSDHVAWEDDADRDGKQLVYRERIADLVAQQLIVTPQEFDVIVCPNLNGEFLSDIAAALIGGRGVAQGASLGDGVAVFEPNHGSAPKHAGTGTANPIGLILSGAMMLRHIGWARAAGLVERAVGATVKQSCVTQDLARRLVNATVLGTAAFGEAVIRNMEHREDLEPRSEAAGRC